MVSLFSAWTKRSMQKDSSVAAGRKTPKILPVGLCPDAKSRRKPILRGCPEVPSSSATERMPGTVFDLMGEAREPDPIQDPIQDRTCVRGDGSTSWKRYSEDNRNKGRRGEAGVAEPRIQHGQILHFDVTSLNGTCSMKRWWQQWQYT